MASVLVDTFGTGAFMSLAVLFLVESRGYEAGLVGAVLTAAFILSFLSIPLCARIIETLGPKPSLIVCCATSCVGYALYSFAPHIGFVFLSALAVAIADRLYAAAWPTLLSHLHGSKGLSRVFASVAALKTLFMALGALSSSVLLGVLGRDGLGIALWMNVASYAASGLILCVDGWRESGGTSKSVPQQRVPLTVLLRDIPFVQLIVSQTLLSVCWTIPTYIYPIFIALHTKLDIAVVSTVLVVRYVVIMVVQVPIANAFANYSRRTIVLVSVGLGLVAACCSSLLPTLPGPLQVFTIYACTIAMAVSETIAKPSASALAVEMAPREALPSYMATFQITWTLAYALAPALAGLSASASSVLWPLIISCLILAALPQFIPNKRK